MKIHIVKFFLHKIYTSSNQMLVYFIFSQKYFRFLKMDIYKCPKMKNGNTFPKKISSVTINEI